MSATSDEILDAKGLRCPEPLMLVRNRMRTMASGQRLQVLATDPATARDLRDFCRFMGHQLLAAEALDTHWQFLIQKA